jgi:hypothetical protein
VRGAGRGTNLALLMLLVLALSSGVVAFAVGDPGLARVIAVIHGVAGLAIVALIPWKSVVARRGWRRGRPGRGAGLTLAVVVAVVLASGLLHSQGGFRQLLGLTPMQLHVGAAVIALALLAAHLTVHPTRPRRTDATRRAALGGLGLAATAAVAYAVLEAAGVLLRLPGGTRRQTGSHPLGADAPARMPITQWFTDTVPTIDASAWRVAVSVAGPQPRTLPRRTGRNGHRAGRTRLHQRLVCRADLVWYPAGPVAPGRRARQCRGHLGDRLPASVAGSGRKHVAARYPRGRQAALGGAWCACAAGRARTAGSWWVKWVSAVELSDQTPWLRAPFPLQ